MTLPGPRRAHDGEVARFSSQVMLSVRESLHHNGHGDEDFSVILASCISPSLSPPQPIPLSLCPPDQHAWLWLGFLHGSLYGKMCIAGAEGNLSLARLRRQQVQQVLAAMRWLEQQRDRPRRPSPGQGQEEPMIRSRRRSWSALASEEPADGGDEGTAEGEGDSGGGREKRKRRKKRKKR